MSTEKPEDIFNDRSDLHLEMRHDAALIFDEETNTDLLKAIESDFRKINFNCHLVKPHDKKEHFLLIGLNDETKILQAAEN